MILHRIVFAILLSFSIPLSAADIVEGQQYKTIQPPILTSTTGNQIEVIDFFSYGCPHCATLAPYFAAWEKTKPENVVIKKIPVEFNPTWRAYGKLYYVAEALQIEDKMTPILFDAVITKRLDLTDQKVAEKLFVDQGVSAQKFQEAYGSLSVETKLNQANVLTKQYKVTRTPLLIIDGRYETNLGMAGGPAGLNETLNFLIAKVEQTRQSNP